MCFMGKTNPVSYFPIATRPQTTMEVYQLRYFAAIARAGSMIAAAAECHVTQPTLSAQMKALEGELGVKLFKRHASGTSLTIPGERVLTFARHLFEEIEALREDISRGRLEVQATLRVGIQPFLVTEILSGPLQKLVAQSNNFRIRLRERHNELLLDLLQSEQVDVCLMSKPPIWPSGLVVQEIRDIRLGAYCRTDHPLANRTACSLKDLLHYSLIVFSGTSGIVNRLRTLSLMHKIDLHIALTSDYATTALTMASKGSGVALLPCVFKEHCGKMRMKEIPLNDAGFTTTICVVWRSESEPPAGVALLLKLIRGSN